MDEINELYEVLKIVIDKNDVINTPPIPLFSFEGLPGAGKTTQIKRVAKALENEYGKAYYIDLPTKSPVGSILKSLYVSEIKWNEVRQKAPWFNPLMISLDLRLAMKKAIEINAKYALMSRGILSTYYYNLDAYKSKTLDEQWEDMRNHMKAFYKPTAIIFMDIPEKQAYERVVKRNRGPLRKMDQVEQMRKDKELFSEYLRRLGKIPVHYIDASGDEEAVTNNIKKELERYLVK